jgi:N-acetylmuramic acid 6-phosphate etherase
VKGYIAIEAGATHTVGGLYDDARELVREAHGRGANPIESGVSAASRVIAGVARELMQEGCELEHLVAAVAGAGKGDNSRELAVGLCRTTGAARVSVCTDVLPILHANIGDGGGVLVIAGTGSSVMARAVDGTVHLVGGHGAVMGDLGSGYRIGLEALRACAEALDGTGEETALLEAILSEKKLSGIDDLVLWSEGASKSWIADLCETFFECAKRGDGVARRIMYEQASYLTNQVIAARDRAGLAVETPVITYGGLLMNSVLFARAFSDALSSRWSGVKPIQATTSGHGAVSELLWTAVEGRKTVTQEEVRAELPATEGMLRAPKPIDAMSGLEITDWMTEADSTLASAMRSARESIAGAIETAADCYAQGGRIIYLGAGTSGRIGVLDASECPPTFGVSKERVVGLIAGGDDALRNSVEDAEDSAEQAKADLNGLSPAISGHDFVVGITASGTTPYVLGALECAKEAGARTCLMACNAVTCEAAEQFILLETGPEVLPGSTRLKAGTATKLALNQITTGAMARCGHIYEGYMVGVKGVNAKLKARTVRIVSDLLGVSVEDAGTALDVANGDIKVAILMNKLTITREDAQDRLEKNGGHLREALKH